MNICRIISLIILSFNLISCGEDVLPKPKGLLRLDYPKPDYSFFSSDCPYGFDLNALGNVSYKNDCSAEIEYPLMEGTLYLTYRKVDNNINTLLGDAQKITYEHTRKADNILEEKYVNERQGVYGMFYDISGNAASQSQFYVTDSTHHFITGSIYFRAKPNYDSIFPAAIYLKNDIRRLMETIRWKINSSTIEESKH